MTGTTKIFRLFINPKVNLREWYIQYLFSEWVCEFIWRLSVPLVLEPVPQFCVLSLFFIQHATSLNKVYSESVSYYDILVYLNWADKMYMYMHVQASTLVA